MVKKTETMNIEVDEPFSYHTRRDPNRIGFTPLVVSEIDIPIKNQPTAAMFYSLWGKDNVDTRRNFRVFYNGSIYSISREADYSKHIHAGAPDVREVFANLVEKEESWEIERIPPVLLRQNIFFVYLIENEDTQPFLQRIFAEPGNVYLYLPESGMKYFNRLLANFLHLESVALEHYYEAIEEHDKLEKTINRLSNMHRTIRDVINKSMQRSSFDVYGHYKHSKELERLISQHYSILVDHSINLASLKERTETAEGFIDESFIFQHFKKELMEELEYKPLDMDTLSKCAGFAREIIQKSFTTKAALLGASLGIIGTIVGTILLDFIRAQMASPNNGLSMISQILACILG
ncbi:MAG: hypothetical protein JSV57_00730 [Candidatus Bathyarchaeota archaeon]|nr:MAG: hypothetical protein JSV57_00730 [Candidatus Bathyarchaeota archaeon]